MINYFTNGWKWLYMRKKDFLTIVFSECDEDDFLFQDLLGVQFKKHTGLFFSMIDPNQRYSKEVERIILHKIDLIINQANNKTKLIYLRKALSDKVCLMKKKSPLKEKLASLIEEISEKLYYEGDSDDYSFVSFLIFEEKNIEYLRKIVKQRPTLLRSLSNDGKNIFYSVLERYLALKDNDTFMQNYYYQVLDYLINVENEHIMKDKYEYLMMIYKHDNLNSVVIKRVLDLFETKKNHSIESLCEKYDINISFDNLKANEALSKEIRYDFTNQEVLTIDSENDLCLDDGFYIEKVNDEYILYIHISDIPCVVRKNTPLDMEAYHRGETIYLRELIIPMIPEEISNNIASLLPNKNTNVISYIFKFDKDFNLIKDSFKVVKGKVSSKHKLSYLKADHIIKDDSISDLHSSLLSMYLISMKLKENNPDKEIYRKLENLVNYYHHDLNTHESLITDFSCSANIVQEFMILVNKTIAEYFYKKGLPFVYRVHQFYDDKNPPLNYLSFKERLKQNNLKLDNYEQLLKMIPQLILNARYSDICLPHEGINVNYYSHTTSPARRYADVVNEQLIYKFLFQSFTDQEIYQAFNETKEKAKYLNERKKQNIDFASEYHRLIRRR